MTKKFVYQVAGFEFVDTTAFGSAWIAAQGKAAELQAPIYRLVIRGESVRQEALFKGGVFLPVTAIKDAASQLKIFGV